MGGRRTPQYKKQQQGRARARALGGRVRSQTKDGSGSIKRFEIEKKYEPNLENALWIMEFVSFTRICQMADNSLAF